ncbi:M50 family metallopeptidase [Virgibacillus sp. DJP39]|uniref:M50 family metallopeptidase n=1 Tax=Virgibacillus sp. DJP39 TaxID=3409790 RepID=UPI003BB69398
MNFLIYLLISLILLKIPRIRRYFEILNTLIHEVGHFIVALIFKCKVGNITMNKNGSGNAVTYTNSKFKKILVSLSGYTFSSLTSLFFIFILSLDKIIWIAISLAIVSTISLIFWVRKKFGIMWIISFLGLLLISYGMFSEYIFQQLIIFLVATHLMDSIISVISLFKITIINPEGSGDSYNLSKETFFPPIVWSLFFLVFSLSVVLVSIPYWI